MFAAFLLLFSFLNDLERVTALRYMPNDGMNISNLLARSTLDSCFRDVR